MAKSTRSVGHNSKREYWLPYQEKFDVCYNSNQVQVLVACLIGANFLTNIVEKEIDPSGTNHENVFEGFELTYNILFTIELLINMYAHWFWLFWMSGWNVFDVVVVLIGIIDILQIDLPSGLSLLRMMRAFRVFRLFKRVHSLNKIIVAIVHAIPGMMNAFLILGIFMSIYAILAVELYRDVGEGCTLPNSPDAWTETARLYCMGFEYFGSFSKSLYSFFQVLTGESWAEAIARPSIWFYWDEWPKVAGGMIYFVSYYLLTAFVMLNVVTTVLLDKMVDPDVAEAAVPPAEDPEEEESEERIQSPEDLVQAIDALRKQVVDMDMDSEKMSLDMDAFTSDVAAIKREVDTIFEHMRAETATMVTV